MTSSMIEFLILNERYLSESATEYIGENILITNDENTESGYPFLPCVLTEKPAPYIWLYKRIRQTFLHWIKDGEEYGKIFAEKTTECFDDYGVDDVATNLMRITYSMEEYREEYIKAGEAEKLDESLAFSNVGLLDDDFRDELEEDINWLEDKKLITKKSSFLNGDIPCFSFRYLNELFTFTDTDIYVYEEKGDRVTDILMERESDKTLWRVVFVNSEFQYMMKDFLNMVVDGDFSTSETNVDFGGDPWFDLSDLSGIYELPYGESSEYFDDYFPF